MKKKVISLLLSGAMLIGLFAGCGSTATQQSDGGQASAGAQEETSAAGEAATGETGKSWSIAGNTWGTGAYALDVIVTTEKDFCNQFGFKIDVANNEFTADKVVTQLQSQMANNPDSVLFLGIASTTFNPIISLCESAKVPYVFDTNAPEDAILQKCLESPYFCGLVTCAAYDMGYQMGEKAASDGNKTAVITAASIGDYSHDNRIAGFTKAFEAAGGKVIQVSHSSDPSEAVAKTSDLLSANPKADCIYGAGGDYVVAAVSVLEQRANTECKVYGTDVDPGILEAIQKGKCDAANGGQYVAGALCATLLINYLDGHQILDADGKAPCFTNLSTVTFDKENVDKFVDFYATGDSPIEKATYEKLLYRYNKDVSYDTYNEMLEGYADSVYKLVGAE